MSHNTRSLNDSRDTAAEDSADQPLIQMLFEDGPAHVAVYSGARLTGRSPAEFVMDAVIAMSEMAQWENLGASVWVRDNTGFAHCLTPAIRGLRPPASYRSGGELPPAGAAQS